MFLKHAFYESRQKAAFDCLPVCSALWEKLWTCPQDYYFIGLCKVSGFKSFVWVYQNLPKVKTRGKKRVCVICSTLFYDLGRNSDICMKHIITPEDKSLISLISKIDDYIERNTSDKIFVNDEMNINDKLHYLFRYRADIDNCWK